MLVSTTLQEWKRNRREVSIVHIGILNTLLYVKIAIELVLLQFVMLIHSFFTYLAKNPVHFCPQQPPITVTYSRCTNPFSKVINNSYSSYVCRRNNNITCSRFKLQMHFYIVCTTWTALSTLVRKKRNSVYPNLLKRLNTKCGKQQEGSMHWNTVF